MADDLDLVMGRKPCLGEACGGTVAQDDPTGWCDEAYHPQRRQMLKRLEEEGEMRDEARRTASTPAPPDFKAPTSPEGAFFCRQYGRLVSCDTCIQRQRASVMTSNYDHCMTGRCGQGLVVLAAHEERVPRRKLTEESEPIRSKPSTRRQAILREPEAPAPGGDPGKRLRAEAKREAAVRALLPVKAARRGAPVFSAPEVREGERIPSAIGLHQEREEPAWKRAEARLAQVVPARVMPSTFKPQAPARPKPHPVVAYGLVVEPDPSFDVFTGRHVEVALAVEASRSSRLQAAQPTPANEEPMPEETPQKTCTVEGCIEPLRINNLSGHCKKHKYVSRKAKPEATPAVAPTRRPKAAAAAPPVQPELPSMPAPVALPRPAQLPSEYLLECVEYAMGLQARFGQALTGAKPSASSAPPHDPS